tara:strand:+ start:6064 stop:7275 length:1212 start_codon:yes stop_codon:yes gene_type:complete
MAKIKNEKQKEIFDPNDDGSPGIGINTLIRPERFLKSNDERKNLAFGYQNRFNLLGHVADFVDQLPLTSVNRQVKTENGRCDPITTKGKIQQSKTSYFTYSLTITPNARFARTHFFSAGKERYSYEPIDHDIQDHPNCVIFRPGPREDLVEKALRRIARRQAGSDQRHPVYKAGFTLYMLRKELKSYGHDIRWSDLRDALHILSNTSIFITIVTHDNKTIHHQTNFINGMTWGSSATNSDLYNPEYDRCYCTLNELIAYRLIEESYQAFQFDIYMRLTSFIARRILVTLSLEWRNAHVQSGYKRSMNELLLRYQSKLNPRMFNDYRLIVRALDELVAMNVLSKYTAEKITTGSKREDKDYEVIMYPTARFVSTQIESIGDRTMRSERRELNRPTLQPDDENEF